jgi:hypothetical protein
MCVLVVGKNLEQYIFLRQMLVVNLLAEKKKISSRDQI